MARTHGAEFWQQQVEAQRASGLSIAAYCREHRLAAWSFYYWQRRVRAQSVEASPRVRLLPVTLVDETPATPAPSTDAGIEVRLPSGIALRLAPHFDGASLRRVLEALA